MSYRDDASQLFATLEAHQTTMHFVLAQSTLMCSHRFPSTIPSIITLDF